MKVGFREARYEQLETDPKVTDGRPPSVVKAYRHRLNFIRQAVDERDLHAWKSFRFEKLKGNRSHQYSLRLNDQWRLIIELEGKGPEKTVVIVSIEDYH
jgi:proteic killer suppression protein